MITFGLTGGIASGKSTVTKTFRALGIPMVDADIVARQVVEVGTPGLQSIVDTFGTSYLQSDGTLDRTKLGKITFADIGVRKQVEAIMTPLINAAATAQIHSWHETHKVVGYDAALICEMGNAKKYQPLIVVYCEKDMQIGRLMSRNDLTYPEAMARINAQMSVENKIAMADYTINTSYTIESSQLQTKWIAHKILSELGHYCFECGREYHQDDTSIICASCGHYNF